MGAIARIKSALGIATKNEEEKGITVRIPDKGAMVSGEYEGSQFAGLVEGVDLDTMEVMLPRKTYPLEAVEEVEPPQDQDLPDHPAFEDE